MLFASKNTSIVATCCVIVTAALLVGFSDSAEPTLDAAINNIYSNLKNIVRDNLQNSKSDTRQTQLLVQFAYHIVLTRESVIRHLLESPNYQIALAKKLPTKEQFEEEALRGALGETAEASAILAKKGTPKRSGKDWLLKLNEPFWKALLRSISLRSYLNDETYICNKHKDQSNKTDT